MAKWILICPNCGIEFEHSQINNIGFAGLVSSWFQEDKPKFDPAGNICVCPDCGKSTLFHRTDLLYRR